MTNKISEHGLSSFVSISNNKALETLQVKKGNGCLKRLNSLDRTRRAMKNLLTAFFIPPQYANARTVQDQPITKEKVHIADNKHKELLKPWMKASHRSYIIGVHIQRSVLTWPEWVKHQTNHSLTSVGKVQERDHSLLESLINLENFITLKARFFSFYIKLPYLSTR